MKKLANGKVDDYSECSLFVKDYLMLIGFFANIFFTHISKDCNRVAYRLASYAQFVQNKEIWLERVPKMVIDLMLDDFL